MRKSGSDKTCPACGALFYVQAYRAAKAKFCSKKCAAIGRQKLPRRRVACVCEHCRTTYMVAPYRISTTRFCSYRCLRLACLPEIEGPRLVALRKPRKRMSAEEKRAKKIESDRRYYAENAERLNDAFRKKYATADKTIFRTRSKQWREGNPEKARMLCRRRRERNPEMVREQRRQHYAENKARYKAQAVARQKHIRIATPVWADMEKIYAFYVEAERLTKETGIPHHVDHFYPLRAKTMCGLHVEGNLQILPAIANLRKSNRVSDGIVGMIGI